MEGFKEVPEHPEYLVSRSGEIYSTKTNSILKTHVNNKGRMYASFSNKGRVDKYLVSRLIARVYLNLPSLTSNLEVDHKDQDKTNDKVSNLQVLTKEKHLEKTFLDRGYTLTQCINCGTKLDHNTSIRCNECYLKSTMKNPTISIEDIEYWITNYSWVRAGKELGLSDNGLRKRYKRLSGKDPKNIKKG